jgi:hypothetical protein
MLWTTCVDHKTPSTKKLPVNNQIMWMGKFDPHKKAQRVKAMALENNAVDVQTEIKAVNMWCGRTYVNIFTA